MSASRLRRRLAACAPVALTVLLLLTPSAPAQQTARERFNVGMHVFRRTLFNMGFTPLNRFDQLDPANSILIILGDPDPLTGVPDGLRRFVQQGGSVLVATDWATTDMAQQELESTAGVWISGESLTQNDKKLCYGEKEYRPFLVAGDLPSSWLLRGKGRDDQQLRNVATDTPSRLAGRRALPKGIDRLAYLPGGCWVEPVQPGPPRDYRRRPQLFAVGGEVDKGRILVMADHSIFINALMIPSLTIPKHTDNVPFTYNALTWLRHDDPNRRRVLLVIDGQIETRFEVPLKHDKLTPRQREAMVTALVDKGLGAAERKGERGVFNQWLAEHLPLGLLARWMVGLLSAGLLLYLIYRFTIAGQHKLDAAAPLLARAVAQARPEGVLTYQRQVALLKQGNLWEEARGLARRLFTSALAHPVLPTTMPRVEARGNWWRQWSLRRQVELLWRLARAEQPQPIGPRQWHRLLGRMDEVKAALADGTLSLHA
jgi:hypothetical protein